MADGSCNQSGYLAKTRVYCVPLEMSEVCHLNDISRSPVSKACGHVVSNAKDKLSHLFPLTTENNAPSLMDLHGPMCVLAAWTHSLNDPRGGQF